MSGHAPPAPAVARRAPSAARIAVAAAAVLLAVPLVPFGLFGELPGLPAAGAVSHAYVFAAGVGLLAGDVFLPVPSSLVAVSLGARLGIGAGTATIFLGLLLGSLVGYAAGWYLGYPALDRYGRSAYERFARRLDRPTTYVVLAALRAVPVLAEASLLAAGAARLQPRRALATLTLANLWLALLYGTFGGLGGESGSPGWLLLGGIGVPALAMPLAYLLLRRPPS